MLSVNENAIHLLEQNQEKINWDMLSLNKNAIHLLQQNQDKINWNRLSENENAIHLLHVLDYEKTKKANEEFSRELCEYVFHPERMIRLAGDMPLWDYLEYYEN
jgi:hypothetical protein